MAQSTRVVALTRTRMAQLKASLERGAFDFRSVPHALFSVKGEGVVATAYASGKLVVQGDHPTEFLVRYVEPDLAQEELPRSAAVEPKSAEAFVAMVGSDESGKGDYFGPLVVCAVRLEPAQSSAMQGGAIRDSKQMTDEACLRLGAGLRASVPHAIALLAPPDYNAAHARYKNLNPLLADLHAKAIREVALPGMRVLVDQFANVNVMKKALAGTDIDLIQHPRAESVPAVAAASVIAREMFLTGLRELSEQSVVDLPKGAGWQVDQAARKFIALHGFDKLGSVAKLHFKNTQKIPQADRP
ncbi:MAG TPA: ribonuclease HIII [Planctomycetota bacterium]|nr:ribonuclease HIII [Planctomycetota bacterium]